MKISEIEIGGVYRARLRGQDAQVRVERMEPDWWTERNRYSCTNLATGCKIEIKSAAKFRVWDDGQRS